MATKICRTCGIEKDICEFIPKRNHCKVCIKAHKKEYYAANSEKIKAYEDERSKRKWIKRCMQEHGMTEQEAIIQHEIMQVGRAASGQQTETKNELMTMGIF